MSLFSRKKQSIEFPKFKETYTASSKVLFDDVNRLVKTNFSQYGTKTKDYVRYEDILDLSIVDDNNIIKKSGAGGAIGGAVLFGPVGMVAGGLMTRGKKKKEVTEKLHINLILKNGTVKTIYFINSKTKHNSFVYKAIYPEFLSAGSKFEEVINNNNSKNDIKQELIDLKELLDLNVITQEEFDKRKLEILRR